MDKKVILHLCADIGSDSYVWEKNGYTVIRVGEEIGVENFSYSGEVFGIICNPPCTEFSTARSDGRSRDPKAGMGLVRHCLRIIDECRPQFWVLENPARGDLRKYLGEPKHKYQPWHYGSPWTKETGLWGNFNMPPKLFTSWDDVEKIPALYTRPGRGKPSLAFMHISAIKHIEEFLPFVDRVVDDAGFRSLCSQKFARAFFDANKEREE